MRASGKEHNGSQRKPFKFRFLTTLINVYGAEQGPESTSDRWTTWYHHLTIAGTTPHCLTKGMSIFNPYPAVKPISTAAHHDNRCG